MRRVCAISRSASRARATLVMRHVLRLPHEARAGAMHERRGEGIGALARGVARCERGLASSEYVVLLVLICALSVAAWNVLGNDVACKLSMAMESISSGLGVASASPASGQCRRAVEVPKPPCP